MLIIASCLAQTIEIPLTRNSYKDDIESQILKPGFNPYKRQTNILLSYTGQIEVGNGKKSYNVIFDSGSNSFWLPSTNCVSSKECDGLQNSYNCTLSDGCTSTDISDKIKYLKGEVEGNVTTVQLSVQGLNPIKQNILLIEKSKDQKNLEADGVFGLGVYDLMNYNGQSFVSNLKSNNTINETMFSFYLGFNEDDSQLVIGGFNPSKLQNVSEIYFHPVIMGKEILGFINQRWSLEIKSFSFSTMSYNFTVDGNISIVDSGSSFIVLQESLFQNFTQFLKEKYDVQKQDSGLIVLNCQSHYSLPDLKFSFADHEGIIREYSIPPSFYILQMGNTCIVMVQSMKEADMDVAVILGNVFMRRYVSIFTHTNSTVGLSLSIATPSEDEIESLSNFVIFMRVILFSVVAGFLLYWIYQNRNIMNVNSQSSNQFSGRYIFIGESKCKGIKIGGSSKSTKLDIEEL